MIAPRVLFPTSAGKFGSPRTLPTFAGSVLHERPWHPGRCFRHTPSPNGPGLFGGRFVGHPKAKGALDLRKDDMEKKERKEKEEGAKQELMEAYKRAAAALTVGHHQ